MHERNKARNRGSPIALAIVMTALAVGSFGWQNAAEAHNNVPYATNVVADNSTPAPNVAMNVDVGNEAIVASSSAARNHTTTANPNYAAEENTAWAETANWVEQNAVANYVDNHADTWVDVGAGDADAAAAGDARASPVVGLTNEAPYRTANYGNLADANPSVHGTRGSPNANQALEKAAAQTTDARASPNVSTAACQTAGADSTAWRAVC